MRHKRRAAVLAATALVLSPLPAFASGAPAPSEQARVQSWLSERLGSASADEVLRVFVHADSAEGARSAVEASGLRLVETFDKIGVAVADGVAAQIADVRTQPGVSYVEGDQPAELHLDTSHIATRGAEAIETLTGADGSPLDGSGISIAVIDSGIDGTHPFFREEDGSSKVVRNLKNVCPFVDAFTGYIGECLVDVPGNDSDTPSMGGHGTHVAGIAAGVQTTLADGRTVMGAAPGAKLIGLSVGQLISVYGGNTGLNWVLDNHAAPCGEGVSVQECPPIRVTNNSYGVSGGSDFDPESTTAKLQRALLAEGVLTAWSAGNSSGDGTERKTNGNGADPTPGILMVASYNDGGTGTRDGALSSFSSRGKDGDHGTYPDISAPGDTILSSCRPYLAICNSSGTTPVNGPAATDLATFNTISGTSMAAPHIAGIIAQLLEAEPTATPEQVELALEDSAHRFTTGAAYEPDPFNPGSPTSFDKGHGLVDVVAAYAALTGTVAAPAPVASCEPNAAFTDASGDATSFVVDTPLPSEPSLDVVLSSLGTDLATGAVTFTIGVEDLTPPTGAGQYFDYNATIGGKAYYLSAARLSDGTEEYALGDFTGAQGTRKKIADLTGSFDDATDEIRVVLGADQVTPALADGTVIGGLNIVSRRELVLLVPNADAAAGSCTYTVGAEHATAEEPVADGKKPKKPKKS